MDQKRNLTLRLLVDMEIQRVLFAEAGKDVVDFLFGLLALPVGTVARLLADKGMVGSVGKLYGSLERLDDTYMHAGFKKSTFLRPPSTASFSATRQSALLLENYEKPSLPVLEKKYYRCEGGTYYNDEYGCRGRCDDGENYVTDGREVPCPGCKRPMKTQMTYVAKKPQSTEVSEAGDGFVKGVVTYMVMDDLTVQPMSTISCITILNMFGVSGVSSLEEQTVELGLEEGLLLLKAAFRSETVLSDVFLQESSIA